MTPEEMKRVARVTRCPECGEPARVAILRVATVRCAVGANDELGDILSVASVTQRAAREARTLECGGGHQWDPSPAPPALPARKEGEHSDCPFCGAINLCVVAGKERLPRFWVRCIGCAAEGPWAKTRAGALASWNRRADVARNGRVVREEREGVDSMEASHGSIPRDTPPVTRKPRRRGGA